MRFDGKLNLGEHIYGEVIGIMCHAVEHVCVHNAPVVRSIFTPVIKIASYFSPLVERANLKALICDL